MSRTSIELLQYPAAVSQPPSIATKRDETPPLIDDTRPIVPPDNAILAEQIENPTKSTTAIVLVTVVCVTAISTLLAGIVTVALPTMANELELAPSVLLWPISIYALTCGCTLLLLGSVADVVGSRPMYLTGCVLQSGFTLACGLAQTGAQLIMFRAFAGVAISFCLPSAVSIITSTFPEGKRRNIAFASMGAGQPIGFSLGLTLGGVFSDTIGWRWGFHIAAILNTAVFAVGFFGLPRVDDAQPDIWNRLKTEIDWVGIVIGGASLAMLSYSFAMITGNTTNITNPETLTTLVVSIALIPAFIFWVGRQERLGRPAIIPNSLWRNRIFTCICIGVFVTWGVFNAIETFLTLFFQDVQNISAIETSVRFLPAPVSGALSNIVMGLIAHKVRADWAVTVGITLTSIGALLMCIIQPEWSYWSCAFFAMFLNPIGADALFTISNLVITSVFPGKTQALAGGVFNTVAQIGKSVGLATSAVVASSITARSRYEHKDSPAALMEGYRAAFWYIFALSAATIMLFVWGLRGIGKVGMKRE
ncbi:major facilitator superfamily domain-containing protein [Massariosphaeria phaeospora]|uniref:Major facilitator superfamily domain-containing protein n=1 Tax=Massariosphaeria phaeospora TaxID=100035 RepID=A0A7C8INM3_9PLEO|nr:major facilitator superfamily domain-containing protein [Massariosphaeria phaeospora]